MKPGMIENDSDDWIRLSCVCPGAVSECRITDADRTDEAVAMPSEMPPRSFLVAITEYPPNTDRAMPDGKTAFDIRDYGAAEDNSAAQNAAAIQQALEVAGKAAATMSAPSPRRASCKLHAAEHPCENVVFRDCSRVHLDRLAVRHHPGYGGGRPDTFMEIEHYHLIEMQEASPDDATLIGSVAQGEA